jgi:hypothetical protein
LENLTNVGNTLKYNIDYDIEIKITNDSEGIKINNEKLTQDGDKYLYKPTLDDIEDFREYVFLKENNKLFYENIYTKEKHEIKEKDRLLYGSDGLFVQVDSENENFGAKIIPVNFQIKQEELDEKKEKLTKKKEKLTKEKEIFEKISRHDREFIFYDGTKKTSSLERSPDLEVTPIKSGSNFYVELNFRINDNYSLDFYRTTVYLINCENQEDCKGYTRYCYQIPGDERIYYVYYNKSNGKFFFKDIFSGKYIPHAKVHCTKYGPYGVILNKNHWRHYLSENSDFKNYNKETEIIKNKLIKDVIKENVLLIENNLLYTTLPQNRIEAQNLQEYLEIKLPLNKYYWKGKLIPKYEGKIKQININNENKNNIVKNDFFKENTFFYYDYAFQNGNNSSVPNDMEKKFSIYINTELLDDTLKEDTLKDDTLKNNLIYYNGSKEVYIKVSEKIDPTSNLIYFFNDIYFNNLTNRYDYIYDQEGNLKPQYESWKDKILRISTIYSFYNYAYYPIYLSHKSNNSNKLIRASEEIKKLNIFIKFYYSLKKKKEKIIYIKDLYNKKFLNIGTKQEKCMKNYKNIINYKIDYEDLIEINIPPAIVDNYIYQANRDFKQYSFYPRAFNEIYYKDMFQQQEHCLNTETDEVYYGNDGLFVRTSAETLIPVYFQYDKNINAEDIQQFVNEKYKENLIDNKKKKVSFNIYDDTKMIKSREDRINDNENNKNCTTFYINNNYSFEEVEPRKIIIQKDENPKDVKPGYIQYYYQIEGWKKMKFYIYLDKDGNVYNKNILNGEIVKAKWQDPSSDCNIHTVYGVVYKKDNNIIIAENSHNETYLYSNIDKKPDLSPKFEEQLQQSTFWKNNRLKIFVILSFMIVVGICLISKLYKMKQKEKVNPHL